jgi:peptidoglycan hydrolase CwlO-like protein
MYTFQLKNAHISRLVAGICLISLFFGITPVFSQTPEVQESLSETSLDFLRQNLIIKKLRDQLNFNTNYYKTLVGDIENTKSDLKDTQIGIKTLEDQIQEIDRQVRLSESRILTTKRNIRETEVRIEKLYETIDLKEIELEENKRQLASYLKLMYIHEKRFGDTTANGLNIVKLLFADSSLSETLQRETYLKIFRNSEEDILQRLDQIKRELDIEQENLSYELGRLQDMKEVLEDEKKNLEAQKAGKERLLAETQGKEEFFQKMLAQN